MSPSHVINEEYGDYVYRRERNDFTSPLIGVVVFLFGFFAFFGGIFELSFSAIIFGVIIMWIGYKILRWWNNKQKELDGYYRGRKKIGAAIHRR